MKIKEYDEFMKRYVKFKKNNLPTPFWDDERQTLEYVYYSSNTYIGEPQKKGSEACDVMVNVNKDVVDALSDIASTGFYYPYTCKYFRLPRKDEDNIIKIELGRTHVHSFSEVVSSLYDFPESFKIEKEDEKYYSEQELKYLIRVQKYLLLIGLKDLDDRKPKIERYRNKKQKLYGDAYIRHFSNNTIDDFLKNKCNFFIKRWYPEFENYFNNNKKTALFSNENDDFIMFVEYTDVEIKIYKEVKHIFKVDDIKDDEKVIIQYFKILENFNNKSAL